MSTLAKYFNPIDYQFLSIIALFFPLLFTLSLFLVTVLLVMRSKFKFIFVQILVLLAATHTLTRFVAINTSTAEGQLKISSYNVHGFNYKMQKNSNVTVHAEIINTIKLTRSDFVCIQEFRSWSKNIESDLQYLTKQSGLAHYHFTSYWKKGGTQSDGFLILSRFPIVNNGSIPSQTKRNIGSYADVLIDSQRVVRIINVHLASFSLKQSEIDVVGEAPFMEIGALKINGIKLFGKLQHSFGIRAVEIEDLSNFIAGCTLPLLICGDFNDTPSSYTYQEIRALNIKDAHLEAGSFFGATYAGNLPWLRIDYIFFSQHLKPGKKSVSHIHYSDHFPLSFSFSMN